MRKVVILLLLSGLVTVGVGGSRAKYRLKVAFQAPERSAWGRSLQTVAREIERETKGQLKIKVYAGGIQGNEATVLRKIRIGQLQGAGFVGSGLVETCPDSLVLNLPLIFQSEGEADFVLKRMRSSLEEQCRKNGYEVLGWSPFGFSYMFSKERIESIAQLRQSKPWLMSNDPLAENLFETLSVVPVTTSIANVLTGLQSGLVRTVFCPPALLIALQWHSRVEYRLDIRIGYSFGVMMLAKKSWDRLPPDIQAIVKRTFKKHNDLLTKKVRAQNQDALDAIAKRGIETVEIKPDSREQLLQATQEVGERLSGQHFSRTALARVKQLVNEYRSQSR